MGELGDAEAHLAERGDAVPDLGEHAPGRVEDDGRHVAGLVQGGLFLGDGEVRVLDEHGHGGGAEAVAADAVGDDAGHVEEGPVDVLRVGEVLGESPLRAVALGFLDFRFHRGVVAAVRVLVQLRGELRAHEASELAHAQAGQVPDRVDAVGDEPLLGLLPDPEQVPHAQGPHLFADLVLPEGMDLVRLLEVRGHLRQELVRAHPDIDREPQAGLDLVLETGGDVHGVAAPAPEAHVQEALVDGKLLQYRRIAPADGDETLGAALVPLPVAADDDQLRALPQRHRHRHGRPDAQLLGGHRRGRDDAPPVARIPRHNRRDLSDVLPSFHDELHRRPAEEGGVHVDMEDDAGQDQ